MSNLAEKRIEDSIRRRIKCLADERKVALSAIALKSGVDQGAVKALYEQDGITKKRISGKTAEKLEAGLDAMERSLGMVKRCSSCGTVLPYGRFYTDKNSKDGLRARCKQCFKEEARERERKDKATKGAKSMNNNTEKAMTAEIVRRVKREDKPQVESKYMAPYFGITPKQLDEVRKGQWDKLLLTPKEPKRADSVLEAVESLRGEIACLRREIETVMVEMGLDVKHGDAE